MATLGAAFKLLLLVVTAYIIWTFKNTPWASTSFLGYIAFLSTESTLTHFGHKYFSEIGTHKGKARAPSGYKIRPETTPAKEGIGGPTGEGGEHLGWIELAVSSALTFSWGYGLLLVIDIALRKNFFNYSANYDSLLYVPLWLATVLGYIAALTLPLLFAALFGSVFGSSFVHFKWMGYLLGWSLGLAMYSHAWFIVTFEEWLLSAGIG